MRIDIHDYLRNYNNQELFYIANPGNAGDSLIASATYSIFDKLNLNYKTLNRERTDFTDKIVIYGGGGNLGLMNNFSTRIINNAKDCAKKIVILPHTIKDINPLLRSLNSNVDIICREQISYDYVRKNAPNANVYISDDLAIHLDINYIINYNPSEIQKLSESINYLLSKVKLYKYQSPSYSAIKKLWQIDNISKNIIKNNIGDEIFAFRNDGEKTDITIPENNIDLSDVLELGVESKMLAHYTSKVLLSVIDNYKIVHTNRLHVCIASALLNKKVKFYSNNYYKCKAVYEYTLKDKYQNISWLN